MKGLEFLCAEVGDSSVEAMEPLAKDVAAMVGYQKLALQMVGNMRCPISRKKKAWEWSAIRTHIMELRRELGLPDEPHHKS